MRIPKPVRHWLTVGAVCGAAATITLAGIPAASASGSYLSFSPDGVGFSPTLTRPVFNQAVQLVPGASTGGSVWVRNDGTEAAYLSAGAVSAAMDPELSGLVSVSGSAGAAGGVPAYLGAPGACSDLYRGWELGAGDAVLVQLTAGLAAEAPNAAMKRSARFDVVFYLQSTDGAGTGPSACEALGNNGHTGDTPPADPGTPNAEVPGNGNSSDDTRNTGTAGQQAGQERPAAATVQGTAPTDGTAVLAAFPAAPAQAQDPDARFNTQVPPAETGRLEAASPASFESTVEPIIRSLSGTLLIVLSVAFFAAAGIRLRSRSR
ncbi:MULTISPECIES: hypothetical protein [unclassified Arthrobacter]|uniref:hypothetical protein n=1 Tax=unclassified Arthrobacter TaxID=235627 RepID=UPI0021057BFE|nr:MULTISPECIES: hypothetical protein [unclassified Arthrobacter]MCQ1947866.1 hypothetical protein [Arthrobacter sp. zg-Y1116]MCQ1996230.1 hypothetical protein [Arthrobacter sp. zg-Y1171]UWX82715.1 hypothetical protein N2L00_04660 [Arthrobacter sp. zg-Y1171]